MRLHPSRRSTELARCVMAAILATVACPAPSDAQIFAGIDTNRLMSLPEGAKPTTLARNAAAPASSTEVLRFLPNTLEGLRMTGEIGDLRWPVYLSAAQAAGPLRIRVGYLNAVSLLPEASELEVKINDQIVGADVLDASQSLRVVEFIVPSGLATRGYNAVSLSVRQRHRVDCSVAATYELWTQIEPSETGLVLATGAQTIADITDLPALLPNSDGTLPIHILLSGKTNPTHLRHLIKATQQIALRTHALQPAVDFGASVVDPYGVNLALGTRGALGRIAQLAGSLGAAGPLLKLLPASPKGRPTIVISGDNDEEIDDAIQRIADMQPLAGTPAGLLAIAGYPAFPTNGGEHLRLRDLGVHSQEFSGRFFRKSFNLMLPADFLASDYGRGTFDLAGGYAAGLARGAQVRVDVNGRSAGVIKLPYADGDVFRHNQLFMPLSLMRPGLNRIDVFAETPRPEDAACAAPDAKRFLFLDTSELVLPTLARVERLPDLALTTSGSRPLTHGTPHLVVPKPDRDTMGAALSLSARAAVAAGTLIPFDFSTKVTLDGKGSTLMVSPARALDPSLMRDIGLDPKAVEAAWRDVVPPPAQADGGLPLLRQRWWLTRSDGPPACRLSGQAIAATPLSAVGKAEEATQAVASAPRDPASDDLLETWSGDSHAKASWRDRLGSVAVTLTGWVKAARGSIHWPAPKEPRSNGISPNASLILAQGFGAGSRENITTIVTASDSAMLRASVACLFDPQVWSKVRGRLAVVDASTGNVTTTDASRFRYVSSGPLSLSNSRLVLAGWFSLNPLAFVALALLTALCLSGTTLWFVRGVGRRPE